MGPDRRAVEDQRGGAAQLEPVAGHEAGVVGEVALLLGARDLGVGFADDDLVVGVDGDRCRADLHFHGHHYCLFVGQSDRILMGPGPSNPYPEVMQALARPVLGHLDPEFLDVLDETCARLRRVFRTENDLTMPISGTGSAGMEAAFVNLVGPGDVVVIGVNGLFGERMCDVADRCGAEVTRVDAAWGEAIDPDRLVSAHPTPKIIAVVHAEPSTGARNDVEPLGPAKGDALLLVD